LSQNFYECLFLLDSNKYARDAGGVSRQVNEIIEKCDGNIRASRLWNEQRLAYQINGHRKGTYWLTYFDMDPTKLTDLNRACQLNNNVMRHLVLKHDNRLAATLVAHALGETLAPEVPAPEVKTEPEAVAVPTVAVPAGAVPTGAVADEAPAESDTKGEE
jgi:small subunit ribosomal protein S6